MLDLDIDGKIDKEDLRRVLTSLNPDNPPTDEILDDMIKTFDKQCSGAIDYIEFVDILRKKEAQEEEMLNAFKILDKDNTGTISKSELYNILTNIGENSLPKENIDSLLESITIQDENVNYEELVRAINAPYSFS